MLPSEILNSEPYRETWHLVLFLPGILVFVLVNTRNSFITFYKKYLVKLVFFEIYVSMA